jgi:CRP/FNR family transcriptional regulator
MDQTQLDVFEIILKRSRILHKGDYLHRQGDPVKSLYIMRSGAVKEYISSKAGDEQILGFFLPGEMIGLDSFHQESYHCSAIALETTTFCSVLIDKFEQLCQKIPDLQRLMLNTMSKVISFEEKMMLTACNKKADERVATFLISLSKRYQHLGYSATEIHLPMSRQDIGCYLGLSNETVSRIFTQLQKNKIISIQPKMIMVNDLTSLKEMSKECHIHKIIEHHIAV